MSRSGGLDQELTKWVKSRSWDSLKKAGRDCILFVQIPFTELFYFIFGYAKISIVKPESKQNQTGIKTESSVN